MANPTVTTSALPWGITIEPTGKFVYVANTGNNTVSQYTINSVDGSLSPMVVSSVATGAAPQFVTADPLGKFLYVTAVGNNTVSQYIINSADGSLSPMSIPSVATGQAPKRIAIDPMGRFAYVANWINGATGTIGSISQYSIDANGLLIPMTPATVTAGQQPMSLTIDPTGKFVYVANAGSNNVMEYAVGVVGDLTLLSTTTMPSSPMSPDSIVIVGVRQ